MIDPFIQTAQDALQRGDLPRAEAALREILSIEPANAWALGLLGGVLAEQGRVEEAVAALEAASVHRPDDPELLSNRAALLYRLGREAEGIPLARRAIAIRPEDPRTHMILAEAWLRRGEFEEGWREYEWRMRMPNYARHGRGELPRPRWDGGDIAGRRIFVHAEQGLGDMLWMIRYVPLLAARGARVIVECEAVLKSLLSRVQGASVVIARGEAVPEFDLHCPVMSLPLAFGTTLATIPANVPYLYETITSGESRGDGFTIGIAWAGGPRAVRRRCPPAVFERLMQVPGVRWVSLQMPGAHVDPLTPPAGVILRDPTVQLHDFADTAALIAQLDLVISVDTVVAHLAGAMGKPVWTLLSYAADWRWLKDRADSPWYPTMSLLRQKSRGDWDSVADATLESLVRQLRLER